MFTIKVRKCGITKTELAELLGLDKGTIYNWRESPPRYALAYIELLKQYNELKR